MIHKHNDATMILALLLLVASVAHAQIGTTNPNRLDSIAASPVLRNRVTGLVAAVVRGNDTILMKAYGKADLEWDVPMTTDAMFEIGSVSKQFTAASILQLRDAGKLNLDDEITKWLPNLTTGGNRVTLRRLLSHTSGIVDFTNTPEFEINYFAPRFPRDSALKLITLEPFNFPSGQAQGYSNAGFWLLGLVVEKASGMKLEDYLQKQIFDPLGMKRSMYCNSTANVPHRAHGYSMTPGATRRAQMVSYTWVFSPGAICSTAGDLVTWLQALHGGKVLSPKSYAEMTTQATLDDGTRVQYGMGIKVGEDFHGLKYIGHGGTAPGFRSDATWYPDAKTAIVVLTNTSPTQFVPATVGGELAGAVLGRPRSEPKYYTGDPAPFVGKYRLVMGGTQAPGAVIEVSQSPNGLAFSIIGSPPEPLPWAAGLTFYAGQDVTLTFRRANGGTGPVTELHRDNAGNHAILKKQ